MSHSMCAPLRSLRTVRLCFVQYQVLDGGTIDSLALFASHTAS